MITAIVLINCQHRKISEVAQALSEIEEFSEVYSVGGVYDLVGVLRVHDNDTIAEIVTEKMIDIEGIENTDTMIAFKVYSKRDIEGFFSVGM